MMSQSKGPPCPEEPPIWNRLLDAAHTFRSKLAVASLHQPASLYGINSEDSNTNTPYLRWNYSDLLRSVNVLCTYMSSRDAGGNAPIVTVLFNRVEFIIAFWAAHKMGRLFLPLNPKALTNIDEIRYELESVGTSMLICEDNESAEKLEPLDHCFVTKLSLAEVPLNSSWGSLMAVFADKRNHLEQEPSTQGSITKSDVVTILFTSGTTSKPKGVPHSNTTLNAFCQNLSLGGRSHEDVFCSSLPNNHAMGYFYTLHHMMNGGAIVYPSPTFDASRAIEAFKQEQVTHTALVPTMLFGLCEALKSKHLSRSLSLKDVCLAGSAISPKMVHQAKYELGAKAVSIGFGMTEGSPIWSAPQTKDEDLFEGLYTVVGRVVPGAQVKLCKPGTREVVRVGDQGEIHQAGPGLVGRYLNDQETECFYEDERGTRWFITGDQAIMHPDGRFSITGRYKDIIVRGGKNISPGAMESVLSKHMEITAQVVGVPDPIAGELPVAVTAEGESIDLSAIYSVILRHMGPEYVPVAAFSLEELGISDFPKTVSGKIQRSKLADLVQSNMNEPKSNDPLPQRGEVKHELLKAYNKATGIPIDAMELDMPITNYADSISLLRVRDRLSQTLGWTLTLEELMRYTTIRSQIQLLGARVPEGEHATKQARVSTSGPPKLADLSIMFGGEDAANGMIDWVSKVIADNGLNGWDDVTAIMPVHDYVQVLLESKIIDTWNFAIAIACKEAKKDALSTALETALANHPILTSFCVYDTSRTAYYVTVNPTQRLWDLCLIDHGSVGRYEDLQQLAVCYPFRNHATQPGPLLRCLLVDVQETGTAGMVIYLHHMVHDAFSQRLFLEDVEWSLKWPGKVPRAHLYFKAWCDSFSALRLSPKATAAVDYHVKRLAGLEKHKKGLYPKAVVPRVENMESPDGIDFAFDAPGLRDLQKADPTIIAVVVLKAAMAIVNVSRTGHTHAMFNNFEACRKSWPFLPDSLRIVSPEAFQTSDVNGPVMQGVCNLVQVLPEETLLCYLQRLQEDQRDLTTHADAPLKRVIDALNDGGTGAGDLAVEIHRAQFLTWVPGFLGEYDNLDVAKLAIRCAAGLVVVAGLGGPMGTTFIMTTRWDVANYSRDLANAYLEDIKIVILWLTSTQNFDKPISALLDYLEATSPSLAKDRI